MMISYAIQTNYILSTGMKKVKKEAKKRSRKEKK